MDWEGKGKTRARVGSKAAGSIHEMDSSEKEINKNKKKDKNIGRQTATLSDKLNRTKTLVYSFSFRQSVRLPLVVHHLQCTSRWKRMQTWMSSPRHGYLLWLGMIRMHGEPDVLAFFFYPSTSVSCVPSLRDRIPSIVTTHILYQ